MAKKTKEVLYAEARELYCYTDLTLSEIGDTLGINVNTLYKLSTKENWVLLKESKIKEAIKAKNIIISNRKLQNIKFYEDTMDLCNTLKDEAYSGKEIKCIIEAHILAEDRYFLLAKEQLELVENDESNSAEGILEELASI